MKQDICLVVIYNHNFEKNIDVIKRIYAGRFSHVYQIMPFYRGNDPTVIGVYECSYQFNGYIAQAASRIRDERFSHYVFVADDMVLNPALNEISILEWLKISDNEAFHPEFTLLTQAWSIGWSWGPASALNVLSRSNACEWRGFLPPIAEARKRFEQKGLAWQNVVTEGALMKMASSFRLDSKNPYRIQIGGDQDEVKRLVAIDASGEPLYPLARGFSDFFVIPASCFDDFCHYCGVFAAMRAFVEVAIPTALVLTAQSLGSLKSAGLKAEKGVLNYKVRSEMESRYALSYSRLMAEYPSDYLFIHPIKLSRWKDLP